jgi:hypothetical protein
MKKLLLLLIIIAGASQLKAQQSTIKPFDQNLFKTPKDQNLMQFKPGDSTLFKNFSVIPNHQLLALAPNKLTDNNVFLLNPAVNIDHMPIAKMNGYIDRMPIAKVSGDIDKMPGSVVIVPKSVTP